MAITAHIYNHTRLRTIDSENSSSNIYKANLYSAFTFDASNTTKAEAETGATQLATANGYSQNSKIVEGWDYVADGTSGAKLVSAPIQWVIAGGSITFRWTLIYNDSDSGDPPVIAYDFGEDVTVDSGEILTITPAADGLLSFRAPT